MESAEQTSKSVTLFGGHEGWHSDQWTAVDDRIRGGASKSYLECGDKTARFHGVLDTKTLGGAGFASQRTVTHNLEWDLKEYAGLQLEVEKSDKKRYTVILKDTLLPPDPDTGREQATISWECDFELPPQTQPGDTFGKTVFVPWSAFNPTYRGKLQKDATPLDLKHIRRLSLMNRSFFGAQEGDFSITFKKICAVSKPPPPAAAHAAASKQATNPRQLEDGTTYTRGDREANFANSWRFPVLGRAGVFAPIAVIAAFFLVYRMWEKCW